MSIAPANIDRIGCSDVVPRLSIGLPVYNGERFIEQTLESILGQTFRDFELIISDNASTDGTERICRAYAARDSRVRYSRNETNVGAARNYNRVFALARAPYFKWAAHDDLCAPEFLKECVDALNADPTLVVAFPKVVQIDEDGNVQRRRDYSLRKLQASEPSVRFRDMIMSLHGCEAVFGVIRSDVLRRTPLIGNYIGSDRVLVALLSLLGPLRELPEYMLLYREHGRRSVKGEDHEVTAWFDPARAGRLVFPYWRYLWEYFLCIGRAPLGIAERVRCLMELFAWIRFNRQVLKWDVSMAVDRAMLLHGQRPIYRWLSSVLSPKSKAVPSWLVTAVWLPVIFVVEITRDVLRLVHWGKKSKGESAV